VDRGEVDRWLRAYVETWNSYARDQIGELFAADVLYRYHPYDDPVAGREAVVRSWLGEAEHAGASARDEPGTYDASYRAFAVDGEASGPRPRCWPACWLPSLFPAAPAAMPGRARSHARPSASALCLLPFGEPG
jgi:hypothetical protein